MTDRIDTPLAVVGVASLFPGSIDVGGFWRDIQAGRDRLRAVPPNYWLTEDHYDPDPSAPDKIYVRRGGFIDPIDFDALGFGIPPNLMPMTDTAQLLALHVTRALIEQTGPTFERLDKARVGVVLGVAVGLNLLGDMSARLQRPVWLKSLREEGVPEAEAQAICDRIAGHYVEWNESNFPGLLGNVVAGRIANRFDLGAINCAADAACASSFSALRLAAHELALGHADLMITGGVDASNDPFLFTCFSKTPALSPTEDCRPFSDQADGTMLGEGVGMVALRRLADAERDGDTIYAVIRGIGASSDGRSKSVYAPRAEGQALALRRAYAGAGYGPETVELVEAHGTGTKAGDRAEFSGLQTVFDESGRADRQWCALGSIKAQIGHTKSAAASASLVKAVLALHHKVLTPTIKVERPNPALNVEASPFYLNTQSRPWVRDPAASHPRRASVSSFGFGGTNFHVALEEHRPPDGSRAPRLRTVDSELLLLSASSPAALAEACRAPLAALDVEGVLPFLARDSQRAFEPGARCRLAIVAADAEGLARRLKQAIDRLDGEAPPAFRLPGLLFDQQPADAPGALAFVFPGQGSQYVGMGAELAMTFDAARGVWDRESAAPVGEAPLHAVAFPPAPFDDAGRAAQSTRLTATEWSQPAIGAVSAALLAVLRQVGIAPAHVAGHSFGDITALFAAGVLDEAGFLRVARRRGELMAQAASQAPVPGSMTAVKADGPTVEALLARRPTPVVCANYNSPQQTVISGPTDALAAVEQTLKAEGLSCRRLPVATAFHSPIVAGASAEFERALADVPLAHPACRVYADATATLIPEDPSALKRLLAEAIASPVRFAETVDAMYAAGARTFVEVGPGQVLSRLVQRCLGDRPHTAVATDTRRGGDVQALWSALGQIAVRGHAIDFEPLWAEADPGIDPRTRRAPRLAVSIDGANLGGSYPPSGGVADLPPPNPPRPAPTTTVAPAARPEPTAAPPPAPAAARHDSPRLEPVDRPVVNRPSGAAPIDAAPAAPAPTWVPTPTAPTLEPTMASPPTPTGLDPLLHAIVEIERQTAEAHQAWHRSAASTHQAFLASSAALVQQLTSALGGQRPAAGGAPALAAPPPAAAPRPIAPRPSAPPPQLARPAFAPAAPIEPAVSRPSPAPTVPATPAALQPVAPRPVAPTPPAAPTPSAPQSTPPSPPPAVSPVVDLEAALMSVVADKTGYPVDVLAPTMDMEADLGIDSIKRVEILSALRDEVPGLPEMDTGAMSALQTLGDVLTAVRGAEGPADVAPVVPAAPTPAAASARPAASSGADGDRLEALLEVIADKTGYPRDVLEPSMHLEGDLGIDSIKRVEILSTLRDRQPDLPEVDTGVMGELQTIGDIARMLGASEADPAAAVPQPTASDTPSASADHTAALLEVVAEKTGYPPEVLELGMRLEGDLGIDSIKRVEILSALRDKLPGLPELDTAQMSQLESLGDVVDFTRGLAGGSAAQGDASPGESTTPTPAAAADGPLMRAVATLRAQPAPGFPTPGCTGDGLIDVTDDGAGVARALVARLTARGFDARIRPADAADTPAVLVALDALAPASDRGQAIALNGRSFAAVQSAAAGYERGQGQLLVTVQDTGGAFALEGDPGLRAWAAGPRALALTAAKEWSQLAVKAIDLARGDASAELLAARIIDELLLGGADREVALGPEGQRRVVELIERPLADRPPVGIDGQSVLVVSGGARGVTAATVVELARATGARLALLGRTPLVDEPAAVAGVPDDDAALKQALVAAARRDGGPLDLRALGQATRQIKAGREIRRTLAAVAEAGGTARYVAVDIRDRASLTEAMADVRRTLGPITGLVHAAGVLADKRIADKRPEQVERVMGTKVDGLAALLDATAEDDLRALVLFSSVASRAGNAGQSDYAMANAVLDAIAAAEGARRGDGCLSRALAWGPWDGGMVTPALRRHFAAMGVPLIGLAAGARGFVAELGAPDEPASVVLGGQLPPPPSRTRETEIVVSAAHQPYLGGHAIRDVAVVPMALAAEWFARTIDGPAVDLRGLEVCRGVRLPDFARRSTQLALADEADGRRVLRDDGGAIRYRAIATPGGAAPAPLGPVESQADWPWTPSELYADSEAGEAALFHRSQFAVIEQLGALGASGAEGQIKGHRAMRWPREPWRLDPAALDGALQLAVLWIGQRFDCHALPTSLGRIYAPAPVDSVGPYTCRVRVRSAQPTRVVFDIDLLSAGRFVLALRDVAFHALPAPGWHAPLAAAS